MLGGMAGVGLALAAGLPAAVHAEPLKIGVVDIKESVDGYKKREALLKELEQKIENVKGKIKQLDLNIKREEDLLTDIRKQENPNQDLLDSSAVSLAVWQREREINVEWLRQLNNRESNKGLDLLLKDVQDAIKKVGEAGQFDVVLQANPGPVVYIRKDATFNITKQVIDQLNKDYETMKNAPPKAPEKN
jgi:Skp family chaperone for outer membrane proteins